MQKLRVAEIVLSITAHHCTMVKYLDDLFINIRFNAIVLCNGMVNYKFMTIFPPVRPYFVRFCLSDVDNGWDWIRKLQQVQDSRFCMYISTQRVLISATSLTKLKEKFKLFLFNFWLGWKSWLCVSCEFMVVFFDLVNWLLQNEHGKIMHVEDVKMFLGFLM